jgi:hypothetical protein
MNYSIVIVVVREEENRLKRCAIAAINYLNKIVARIVEWNVLTTKIFVICAVFIVLSLQLILTKAIKSKNLQIFLKEILIGLLALEKKMTKNQNKN